MSENHVGFTGTRESLPQAQLLGLATTLAMLRTGDDVLHHGDCIGADLAAAVLGRALGYRIVGHPPVNSRLRAHFDSDESLPEQDYHVRNRAIVDASKVLVACPFDATHRRNSGTWGTIRYAVIRVVPILAVGPDGMKLDAPSFGEIAQGVA